MHAEDRTLSVVFETSVRLMVPLFQRPYVWNESDNWEPLWEAINTALERRLVEKKPRPHFLGAIVLDQLDTFTGEVGARQVIDGQQRLTTLQVMIAAIRDLCASLEQKEYQEAFKRLSENFVPSKKDADSTFKVWPTNEDRPHFRNVMSSGSFETLSQVYAAKATPSTFGHLLPDCYSYFYRQFSSLLEHAEGDELDALLAGLFDTVRQDLVLVVVDLDRGDDPQLIFETLNALGTPLLPSDLFKNFLFHQAHQQGENVEELHRQYWKPFDEGADYWRTEIRQGRLKWHRIDLFLAHYLTLLKQEVVSMTHLFGEFRDHCLSNGFHAGKQLASLRTYGDVFRAFEGFAPDSREGLFFQRLDALDTSMVLPVLLEVFCRPKSDADRLRFIEILESYLVRRAVCGLTYKNYNRLFVDLLKRLSKSEFSSEELRKFLLEREGDSAEWPTDGMFSKAIQESPVYNALKRSRTRMVLEAIEQKLRSAKAEKILIDEKLTIEHIMPREWHANWPLPEGADGDQEDLRNHMVHTFGNLSLVNGKLNPSLSNAGWIDKKAALGEHSALAMNRLLQQHDDWDEKHILRRGMQMAEIAVTLWPRQE